MWEISTAHNISLDALIGANPQVGDPSQIQVGQVLNLPQAGNAPSGAPAIASIPPASNVPPSSGVPPPMLASLPPSVVPRPGGEGYKTVAYFTNWVS